MRMALTNCCTRRELHPILGIRTRQEFVPKSDCVIPLFQLRWGQSAHDTPVIIIPSYLNKFAVSLTKYRVSPLW